MKVSLPFSKPTALIIISAFLLLLAGPGQPGTYGQKRAKAQKSESRGAGLVAEAHKLAEEEKWPEAIDAYKLAIRLDPNYARAHGGLGDAYLNSGKWGAALHGKARLCSCRHS